MTVIGTEFIGSAGDDGDVCAVSRGEVVLHSGTEQARVRAGQEGRLSADATITVANRLDLPQVRYRWHPHPQDRHASTTDDASTMLRLNDEDQWTATLSGEEFPQGISFVLSFAPGPETGKAPLLSLAFDNSDYYRFNAPSHLPHPDLLVINIHPDMKPPEQVRPAAWEQHIREVLRLLSENASAELRIPQRQRQLLEVTVYDTALTSSEQLELLSQSDEQ
ncbi:MAG: hypothetical protein EA401_07940 [Planctomycetota bacterium]|nr:MAG: hypothetical protein EA401_07940 [Planctomycetota bacterium]